MATSSLLIKQTHAASLLKKAGSTFKVYFEWDNQTKHKAEIELNFLEYSNSKRYLIEPDIIQYERNYKPQLTYFLVPKP